MFYTAVTRLSLGFEYRHNENKRIHIYFSQRGEGAIPVRMTGTPPPTPCPRWLE